MRPTMPDEGPWEPRRRARRRALQALYQWQANPQSAETLIEQFLDTQDFSMVDAELFKELVTGVMAEGGQLARDLRPHMDRDFERCDIMERVLLLLGAWQLRHDLATPYQVVLNETVDLATRFGSDQSPGYVNAVLDKAAREWRQHTAG